MSRESLQGFELTKARVLANNSLHMCSRVNCKVPEKDLQPFIVFIPTDHIHVIQVMFCKEHSESDIDYRQVVKEGHSDYPDGWYVPELKPVVG